jgi:hypothetical protein
MCVCPYCGHVFLNASRLRKYLRQKKYRERNIFVEPTRASVVGIRQDLLIFWYGGSLLINSRSPRCLPRTFSLPSGNNTPITPPPERQRNCSSQKIDLFPYRSCEAILKEILEEVGPNFAIRSILDPLTLDSMSEKTRSL